MKKQRARADRGGPAVLERGALIALTALVLILQVLFLTHAGPLWRDEVNSVEFARMRGMSETWRNLRFDGFPLLSTLALRGWMSLGLGSSDFGLRIYGFLIAVAFFAALWLTCRRLGGPPLLSLALLGASPWVASTVASIRPYGIGLVFLVLALGAVWDAVKAGGARRYLIAAALSVLSVQCMYQDAVLLLGIGVAAIATALIAGRRGAALGITLAGLAAALSLLPYASCIREARDWNVVIQLPTTGSQLLSTLWTAMSVGVPLGGWPWIIAALAGLYLGYRSWRAVPKAGASRTPSVALFAAALLVLASGVFLAALKSTRLPTEPWYYVPLLVAIVPALDAAIGGACADTPRRTARIAFVLIVTLSASLHAWPMLTERRTNLDRVAAHLAANAVEGDVVIVSPAYYGVAFQRYYAGKARWMTLPPLEETRIHRYDLLKIAMTRPDAIEPALGSMADALASGHRVWLVGGLPAPDPGPTMAALPIAPNGPMGWYCGPYLLGWGKQASFMLSQRALRGDRVSVPVAGPVNPYESVPLMVVSGFR